MKITEALVVLFLVLFCYLFLDKFLLDLNLFEITSKKLSRFLSSSFKSISMKKPLLFFVKKSITKT